MGFLAGVEIDGCPIQWVPDPDLDDLSLFYRGTAARLTDAQPVITAMTEEA